MSFPDMTRERAIELLSGAKDTLEDVLRDLKAGREVDSERLCSCSVAVDCVYGHSFIEGPLGGEFVTWVAVPTDPKDFKKNIKEV